MTRLDLEEFSESVAKLVSDPRLRERKSGEALDEARRWSSVEMARRMLAVYAEAEAAVRAGAR